MPAPAAVNTIARDYGAAWSPHMPEDVTGFQTRDGRIVINGGDPVEGRDALVGMAAGFHAGFPYLDVHCDGVRTSGDHVIFLWTLKGTDSETGNRVKVPGWEEWTLGPDGKVAAALGWFDAAEYDRQIAEDI